jgi:hypothetical protein
LRFLCCIPPKISFWVHPPLGFHSPSEFNRACLGRIRLLTNCSLEVLSPSTFSAVWNPLNLGFTYLVRCAFKLSQFLSAFLLQTPLSLFQPITPLGFSLQSFHPYNQPGLPLGAAYHLALCPSTRPGFMVFSRLQIRFFPLRI